MTELKILHLTDTHFMDHAATLFHGMNTCQNLQRVLAHGLDRFSDCDLILFTGDISQTGSAASYELFRSAIASIDKPIFCVPGNHDTPRFLRQVIAQCPDESIQVHTLGIYNLVLINSWVEDRHHGRVNEACMQQLEKHLSNHGEQFNIIAIHHPPVAVNSRWLDELGLENQAELLQLINRHTQNCLMICGHVHQEVDRQLQSLRLLATPSTCHQFEAESDTMCLIDAAQPAYRYIHIDSEQQVNTSVIYLQ